MSEQNHRVVVAKCDVQAYLDKGYVRSVDTVEQHVGHQMWSILNPEERDGLELMEIPKSKHEAMNTPPRAFMLTGHEHTLVATRYSIEKVDVLERDETTSIVAAGSAHHVCTRDLHNSPRECLVASRASLLAQAAHLRSIADSIEDFLRKGEAL